jgi:hypothetical protein
MTQAYLDHVNATLSGIAADGMMKQERMITSPQSGEITVGGRQVINLCANNYLGLADHPDLIAAARDAMDPKGFGMASVHRTSTASWNKSWRPSSGKTILSSSRLALTPTAGCSSPCSGQRTPLSRTV